MSANDIARALAGEEISVDFGIIERSLAELWRQDDGDHGITKAALWNVIAHATTDESKDEAGTVLSTVSMSVPQRSILVAAHHDREENMRAWISANCHLAGGGQKVCSESITIVAGGARVHHVPPIVNALLIPDMPVAAWWLGDLPAERGDYLEALLDPVDRLIVDSIHFDDRSDLEFVARIAAQTVTRPADLNWARIEHWRAATASMFDLIEIRERAHQIERVTVHHAITGGRFGEEIEARLFSAWLLDRLQYRLNDHAIFSSPSHYSVEVRFVSDGTGPAGTIDRIAIAFRDGVTTELTHSRSDATIRATVTGLPRNPVTVTRTNPRRVEELITRELSRATTDCIFMNLLPLVTRMRREGH